MAAPEHKQELGLLGREPMKAVEGEEVAAKPASDRLGVPMSVQ